MFFPVVGPGFDPVWFGILLVIVKIGLIAPPIGMNVFVLKAVLPDVLATYTIFRWRDAVHRSR